MTFEFRICELDGIALHVAMAGDPGAPAIVCLHGFPEYWAAWREVAENLSRNFFVIVPDQRGYNLSSRPQAVEDYRTAALVADLVALADHLLPGRRFALAGHDWGASVAYAFAMAHPDRLSHLVIANGVHPVCFQRAIIEDAHQRQASQYINRLRAPDAEALLSADGHRRLMRMIEGFSEAVFMNDAMRGAYVEAWSRPGALTAMLNRYRATPLVVPEPAETVRTPPILLMPPERFRIAMPHLVLWGEADQALRPVCLEGLDAFAGDLTVERFAGTGHWILHERPMDIAASISDFVGRLGTGA